MEDKLISVELNNVNGSVNVLKKRYTTEADEFGVEITKSCNWRISIGIGDEDKLLGQLPEDQANNIIVSFWTDELRQNIITEDILI